MKNKLTEAQLRFFNRLKIGQVIEGKVIKITRYGAFVGIGSLNGLLHISEITWGRITDVEDHLKINQKIKVLIIDLDPILCQIKVSYRQLLPHPWETLVNKYKVGDIVVGMVAEVRDYGALIVLKPGLEGLIHISDVQTEKNGKTAHDFFKVDETYQVRISMIDLPKRRIQFTLKD